MLGEFPGLGRVDDDDIRGRTFSLGRAVPVREIAGPFEAGKDLLVDVRTGAEDKAQRLLVAGGRAQSGQLHQLLQGLHGDGRLLVKAAVAAIGENEIFEHGGLLGVVDGFKPAFVRLERVVEDGLTCSGHHLKEIGQVVDGVQPVGQNFLGLIQVPQVGLAEVAAGVAAAEGVQGAVVLGEFGPLDVDLAL